MVESFEFATPTRIVFGAGCAARAGEIARALGRRAFVLTGRDTARSTDIVSRLSREHVDVTTFVVAHEPTIDVITAAREHARAFAADVVLAIGGGSALDAGKATAALLNNAGALENYLEIIGKGEALTRPSAPFIAIPTTAGTGSEVTRNAVLASPTRRLKVSLRSPLMAPTVALVDPLLSADLPPALTASTGLDALTQLVESYVSARATPMTDALCHAGIGRAATALRPAFSTGAPEARAAMALTSLWSGITLANAGLGAVHGLSGPIGGMFDAPHGAVCAALLPIVMAANLRAVRRSSDAATEARFETTARLLSGRPSARADDAAPWLSTLVNDLEIPALRKYGVAARDADAIANAALEANSMRTNPATLSHAELVEIVHASI
jgi:alcohol dehydrogenase class IV